METRWSSCLLSLTLLTSRYCENHASKTLCFRSLLSFPELRKSACVFVRQVTELKGLATHILVGSVICETKELFTAMPQVVAVDVNDLGTIKLNLEVTW